MKHNVVIFSLMSVLLLFGCDNSGVDPEANHTVELDRNQYELKKFYKDPNSPAAKMMGSTYAGVVETFNSMSACLQMKEQVEKDDQKIGYTNSRFVCDKK